MEKSLNQEKINVAIVGLGFGAEFIPIYQNHPNTNMYAICQRDRARLNEIGDRFGVTVRYDDSGNTRTLSADYCVCTIPMPVFARLKTNLPPAYTAAAANTPAMAAGKVGWQAERFWESEAQSIRSGIPRRDI